MIYITYLKKASVDTSASLVVSFCLKILQNFLPLLQFFSFASTNLGYSHCHNSPKLFTLSSIILCITYVLALFSKPCMCDHNPESNSNVPRGPTLVLLSDIAYLCVRGLLKETVKLTYLTSFDLISSALLANSVRQSSWYNTE